MAEDVLSGVKNIQKNNPDLIFLDIQIDNGFNKPFKIESVPYETRLESSIQEVFNDISNLGLNIMTIEDPIEIRFPGISQTQVNTKLGLSFAEGLKAIYSIGVTFNI